MITIKDKTVFKNQLDSNKNIEVNDNVSVNASTDVNAEVSSNVSVNTNTKVYVKNALVIEDEYPVKDYMLCGNNIEYRKSIKSYVNRGSSLTNNQKCSLDSYWSKYGIEVPNNLSKIDFTDYFSNNNEQYVLEIGFGNGNTLVSMAKNEPNKNFIGVEVYKKGIGAMLSQIHFNKLENLKIIWHDAVEVLHHIEDNFFSRVQLYFPDPWPKKRHHKRRIVQTDFVNLISRIMKPGGVFHLATDWEHYAYHILKVLDNNEHFDNMYGKNEFSTSRHHRLLTKFEARGLALGHGVWDLLYKNKV